ncbi:hypothetical protein [Agathobacter sp.]|uniref:hypothetical protein n=1 Tax=Agathobacter sp. TaxID=2021311 RepID=UPI003FD79C3B
MKELATDYPDKYPVNHEEAFVLGVLHDIGYKFSSQQQEHASIGGLLLKEQGYKYWQEVYYHGIPQNNYDSNMLRLLNYADMITGPTGIYMTIQERIDDIAKRYGEDSWRVKEAIDLSQMITEG